MKSRAVGEAAVVWLSQWTETLVIFIISSCSGKIREPTLFYVQQQGWQRDLTGLGCWGGLSSEAEQLPLSLSADSYFRPQELQDFLRQKQTTLICSTQNKILSFDGWSKKSFHLNGTKEPIRNKTSFLKSATHVFSRTEVCRDDYFFYFYHWVQPKLSSRTFARQIKLCEKWERNGFHWLWSESLSIWSKSLVPPRH